jgi:uncharacterized protein (TIGR02246 family)
MRRTLAALITGVLVPGTLAAGWNLGGAPAATVLRQNEETGVRAAVLKRIEGRRSLNPRLSAEPFADDAIWINAFGRRVAGRPAIENFFAELYADAGFRTADVVLQPEIAEIVFLRPDVAVARVVSRTHGQRLPNGTTIAERRTHNTMTLTREPAGWQVRYEIVTDERDSSSRR